MIAFLAILTLLTAGGVYLTERVDRPRRRAMRDEARVQPAE